MKRHVRVLRRAVADLEEIQRYLERDRPDAARRQLERLLDTVDSLAEQAERGAQPRDERLKRLGYRFLVRDAYLIFYKIGRTAVRVHRVLHGRRRYASIL